MLGNVGEKLVESGCTDAPVAKRPKTTEESLPSTLHIVLRNMAGEQLAVIPAKLGTTFGELQTLIVSALFVGLGQ